MPFNAQGSWVPEDDSVVTQLNKITSSDSPYIKLARASGMGTANRRGLLNSSIAAGAAEASAIGAATPLASQDAAAIAAKNLSFQDAGQTRTLAEQQAAAALRAQREQAEAASALSRQESGQQGGLLSQQAEAALRAQREGAAATSGLSAQESEQQRQLAILAAENAKSISSQEAEQNLKYGTTLAGINNAADMAKTTATLGSAERQQAAQAALAVNEDYNRNFTAIAANEALPADTRAAYLNNLLTIRQAGIDMIEATYGIKLNWPAPATATPVTPAPTQAEIAVQNAVNGRQGADPAYGGTSPFYDGMMAAAAGGNRAGIDQQVRLS